MLVEDWFADPVAAKRIWANGSVLRPMRQIHAVATSLLAARPSAVRSASSQEI